MPPNAKKSQPSFTIECVVFSENKNYIYDQLGPEYKNIAKSISSRRVRRRMSRHGWDQKLKRFVSVDDYNPDKIPSYAHTTTIRLAQGLDRKLTLLNEKYEKARDEAAEWKNLYQNLELKYNALKKQLYDAVDSKS